MKRALCALALAIALSSGEAAAADDASVRAKAFFQAGAQAYDAGRFEAAIQAFDEAFRLAPLPAILFSMAQAERKQFIVSRQRDQLDRALAHYRAYVAAQGATRRAEAADALAELEGVAARLAPAPAVAPEPARPLKARLMVTTQAAKASVAVDAAAPVEAPFIDELTPGRHHVKVAAEGYFPEERDVEVVPGPPAGLDLPLKERAGLLTVDAPSGAEIHVDGERLGEVPLARPIELGAGPHSVTLVRRGLQAFSRELVLERGRATELTATMEQTSQRLVSWGVLGAGAAALVGGAACTAVAFERQGSAQAVLDEQARGNITAQRQADYGRAVHQRDQWRTAAEATFGSGAGLLAVGTLLYFLDRPAVTASAPRPAPARPSSLPTELGASATPIPGGAAVAVTGRF